MRILCIYRVDIADPTNSGVCQKMDGITAAMRALGHQVDTIYQHGDQIVYGDQVYALNGTRLWSQFRWYRYIEKLLGEGVYDLLFVRYGLSTPSFIHFLKKYKRARPSCRIIIDMPTYPYEREWTGWSGQLAIMMDRQYRRHLHRYVSHITHSGSETHIYNIPTIPMTNAVDTERISARAQQPVLQNTLHAVAVGKWQYWHGLDRLIEGMSLQPAIDLRLHVIGDGPHLSTLRALVASHGLDDRVIFYGAKTGMQLDALMEQAHIAIGTLGLHRKGVTTDSSLKHREYCARGIPFVLSSRDCDFDASLSFVHYVPVSDQEIDVSALYSWYEQWCMRGDTPAAIRVHAEECLSWKERVEGMVDL